LVKSILFGNGFTPFYTLSDGRLADSNFSGKRGGANAWLARCPATQQTSRFKRLGIFALLSYLFTFHTQCHSHPLCHFIDINAAGLQLIMTLALFLNYGKLFF